jgi:hypothetical protein
MKERREEGVVNNSNHKRIIGKRNDRANNKRNDRTNKSWSACMARD